MVFTVCRWENQSILLGSGNRDKSHSRIITARCKLCKLYPGSSYCHFSEPGFYCGATIVVGLLFVSKKRNPLFTGAGDTNNISRGFFSNHKTVHLTSGHFGRVFRTAIIVVEKDKSIFHFMSAFGTGDCSFCCKEHYHDRVACISIRLSWHRQRRLEIRPGPDNIGKGVHYCLCKNTCRLCQRGYRSCRKTFSRKMDPAMVA